MNTLQNPNTVNGVLRQKRVNYAKPALKRIRSALLRSCKRWRDYSLRAETPEKRAKGREMMRSAAMIWRLHQARKQSVFGGGRPSEGAAGGISP